MIEAGWTSRAIGSATGLPPGRFGYILAQYRKGRRVSLGPVVSAQILNARRPTDGLIGAEPSRRRLRALAVIGWGLDELANETGIAFSTIAMIRNSNERVLAKTALAVADAYTRLYRYPGPSAAAAAEARAKGWPGPLAWNDIDDLAEQPDESGRGDSSRYDILLDADDAGHDINKVCSHLDVTRKALERWCDRHDLQPLYRRLVARANPDWNGNQHTTKAA
ncbi:hypothetical protein [Nocardioides sp.]|uniref:hypothetical protein n=1 Tax=Nocardioides sp. TaxID=35761 RepID=UPI00262C3A01|nr:hypothetical protein [Nocardioides sp.]